MQFDEVTKTISINRGSRGSIKLKNTNGNFKVGDKIKFSIVDKNDYNNLIFQKEFRVIEESPEFILTLTRDDTKIGEIISREKVFNYEIEYNNDTTLIGYDKNKGKKFILYPEAPDQTGSDS